MLEARSINQRAAMVDVEIAEPNGVIWKLVFAGNVGSTLQLVEATHDGDTDGKPEPEFPQYKVMSFALAAVETSSTPGS